MRDIEHWCNISQIPPTIKLETLITHLYIRIRTLTTGLLIRIYLELHILGVRGGIVGSLTCNRYIGGIWVLIRCFNLKM